jgi:tRNA(Ile)-lysidine synthase
MLLLLHELQTRGELTIESIAHLNHQIRPEADADESFCRALAERLGIAFVAARVDVPGAAREKKQSLELAGRVARREFLDHVRRASGADCIATAHTEDDQAETILLRLMRGTGSRGLAGIAPCRDRRVRPMLCATRAELRQLLEQRGERWREDATNADLTHLRNRVRHELLPYLEQHFNPSVRRGLARTADVARAEDGLIARMAIAASVCVLEPHRGDITIDTDRLSVLPEAVQRRVVMQALTTSQSRAPSFDDVERVLARTEHFRGKLVLVPYGDGPSAAPSPPAPFCFELPVPGDVRTDADWIIEAEEFALPQGRVAQPDVAQIDAAAVAGGLFVRSRRPGDRIRPVGLGGSKKLQDVLVDRKVRRKERDAVPIVTDATGRIVWVAGHVLGAEFGVTEGTKGVIILKLRRI